MPELSKVRWSQLKVGIVAFVAMVILAVLIFLLTGNRSIFDRDETVRTYMADGAGVPESAPVRLNGILVGAVQGIKLSGSKDPRRAVEFELTILEKYMRDIPDDSTAAVTAANLLGSKFIDITKGQSATPVKPGGELPFGDVDELAAQKICSGDGGGAVRHRVDHLRAVLDDAALLVGLADHVAGGVLQEHQRG